MKMISGKSLSETLAPKSSALGCYFAFFFFIKNRPFNITSREPLGECCLNLTLREINQDSVQSPSFNFIETY